MVVSEFVVPSICLLVGVAVGLFVASLMIASSGR